MSEPFLPWGRTVVETAALLLEDGIQGAYRSKPIRRGDYEGLYVHFQDAQLPQAMAVWLYATREGASFNVRNHKDVIGVGLKHDKDVELDRIVWRFRRLPLFVWQKHIDDRWEGFRWMRRVGDLPQDPQAAGAEIVERVLAALRRAGAVARP